MRWAPWVGRVIAATAAVCVLLGLVAAIWDAGLTSFGAGPGGLWGLPLVVLFGAAVAGLAIGVPHLWDRRPRHARSLIIGPILVWASFQFFAHALDPCSLGLWTLASEFQGAPLCEDFAEYGLEVHTRWHLLKHGLFAALVAVPLWIALERGRPAASSASGARGAE